MAAAGFAAVVLLACATAPARDPGSIDLLLPPSAVKGGEGRATLAAFAGRVVILDVCASWASACNLNARVLDDVQAALAGEPVEVITLLLDEGAFGVAAQRSYAEVLGVKHVVALAGPRVRAGTSALHDVKDIPRLVILDAGGAIAYDEVGGVVGVEGLVDRARALCARLR